MYKQELGPCQRLRIDPRENVQLGHVVEGDVLVHVVGLLCFLTTSDASKCSITMLLDPNTIEITEYSNKRTTTTTNSFTTRCDTVSLSTKANYSVGYRSQPQP